MSTIERETARKKNYLAPTVFRRIRYCIRNERYVNIRANDRFSNFVRLAFHSDRTYIRLSMSVFSGRRGSSVPCASKKSEPPATVPRKKSVASKDQIVSSKFADVKRFVPSYVLSETKPEIRSLMTMRYAEIWREEHERYEKDVIAEKLVKEKTWKRPTFRKSSGRSETTSAAAAGGGDSSSASKKSQPETARKNSRGSTRKSVWK